MHGRQTTALLWAATAVCALGAATCSSDGGPGFQLDPDASSSDTDADSDSDTDADGDTDAGTDTDVDTDADVDTDTDTDSDTDSDTDTGSDSGSDTGSDSGSDTGSDSGSDTGSGTDSATIPECTDPADHDEDSDAVDDNCDNCPTYVNPWQLNDDADGDGYIGVGNMCEATWNTGLLGHIAVFDAFAAPDTAWNAGNPPSWTYDVDELVGSVGSTGDIDVHAQNLGDGAYSVEAIFYCDPDPLTTGEMYAGVVFAVQGNVNPDWWTCLYEWNSRDLSVWTYEGGPIEMITSAAAVDDSGGDELIWRRVRAYYDGAAELICTFDNQNGDIASVQVEAVDIWPDMSGRGGLRVYNQTAAFQAFVVYR